MGCFWGGLQLVGAAAVWHNPPATRPPAPPPPLRCPQAGIRKKRNAAADAEPPVIHAPTELHDQRLEAATAVLLASGARSVLDLGCGAGALLRRLVREPRFERIVGVDKCSRALLHARDALGEHLDASSPRLSLMVGSYTQPVAGLLDFDGCAMVETIEHVEPAKLGSVEHTVFGHYRPRTLVMTTPNAEFNVILGLGRNEFREADHRFEWSRAKFRGWALGVAQRNGYAVSFSGVGQRDLLLGQPTQMAVFTRAV